MDLARLWLIFFFKIPSIPKFTRNVCRKSTYYLILWSKRQSAIAKVVRISKFRNFEFAQIPKV